MKPGTRYLIVLLFSSVSCFGQAPGGVSSSLRWWLKANAGVFTDNGTTPAVDGNQVQQWNDQSAVANHANQTTAANKPVYKTNIINGNPVIRYSGDQFLDGLASPGIAPTNSSIVFLVLKQTSFTPGGTNDGSGSYVVDRTTATNNLISLKTVNTDKYFYQKRNDDGGSLGGPISATSINTATFTIVDYFRDRTNSVYGLILNGKTDATTADDLGNLTGPAIRLGRHTSTTNGGMIGDIAEAIIYNSFPTATERLQIESYLAIKYGITLDETTARNYLASDGTTIIYPATSTHAGFLNDIAGIGTDIGSGLNQTLSQSQNIQSIVQISNPGSMVNGEFMVWGHNSPSISNSPNVPAGFINRINRVWRVAETGDVGTYDISFDLSGFGIDMTDATKFALLIDGDGNFSDATPHIVGRTISGTTVSFTGVSTINNDYFSLATPFIPGPGGVAGTTAWLRADKGAFVDAGITLATNGQTVREWDNQGATAFNTSQLTAANRPTFVTNAANFNPVLNFNFTGGVFKYLDFGNMGTSGTSDLNFFAALKPGTNTTGLLTDANGGNIIERNSSTASINPLVDLKLLSTNRIGFQKRNDAMAGIGGVSTSSAFSTTSMQMINYYRDYAVQYGILYNGAQEVTLADGDGAITLPNLRIGAHYDNDKGYVGDFGEFIFYRRDLTTNEKIRVHSYLGIKYGITIDQTTLTDYLSSASTVIYPVTTTHSPYHFDIAGIGMDLTSSLTQSASQSANTGSMVVVKNPSSLDNFDFLIWGSDNGSVSSPNSVDIGAPVLRRLTRVWKMAETGETGTQDIAIDLALVPGAKIQADLRLLIDRDGDGFADNDVAPLTGTLAGNIFTVTGINFQHGDRFTVGTTSLTTPLPVQLVYFDAKVIGYSVSAKWQTASELNSDYFIVQRSVDGQEFENIVNVLAAGTTSEEQNYAFIDADPLTGKSYYRLMQVDIDGTFSYSVVRMVDLAQPSSDISVSPNPTSGRSVKVMVSGLDNEELEIAVWDARGVSLHQALYSQQSWKDGLDLNFTNRLTEGIYILRAKSSKGVQTTKFVVSE